MLKRSIAYVDGIVYFYLWGSSFYLKVTTFNIAQEGFDEVLREISQKVFVLKYLKKERA
jgi:hypothetical protein